jgi:thioredoxin reductase (NADPH)
MSAAIQLRRQGLTSVIFERERIGGSLNDAFLLRNVVGKPEGVTGRELVMGLNTSATSLNLVMAEVLSIEKSQDLFLIKHSKGETTARTVIVAVGLVPTRLSDSIVSPEAANSVHYSLGEVINLPKCRIAIVGGGDVSMDYACSLRTAGHEVTLLVRSDVVSANLFVSGNAESLGARVMRQFSIASIGTRGSELRISASDGRTVDCDTILVAIGRERKVPFLSGPMKINAPPKGPVPVVGAYPGLFLCGDILDEHRRYYHHALGTGLMAAESVFEYLSKRS